MRLGQSLVDSAIAACVEISVIADRATTLGKAAGFPVDHAIAAHFK